jgi:hypothetical protein
MTEAKKKAAPRKKAAVKKKPAAKKPAPKKKKLSATSGQQKAELASIQHGAPKPVGRPPKTITQAHLDLVRKLAMQGCTKKNVAAMLGMSVTTYSEKQLEYPELTAVYDLGRQQGVSAVVGAVFQKALLGDAPAFRYWLNNVEPEEWQDKRVIEAGENLGNSIASMRPEDRLELIQRRAAEEVPA